MSLRILSPIFWIAFFLCLLEFGLELRAHRRGWGTLLFGAELAGEAASDSLVFGATEEFPFRSRIVPRVRELGQARLWIASSSYAEDKRLPAEGIFPNRLEQKLREGGLEVQVLNASRNGYSSSSNLTVLREIGSDWRPDVCLLYQMTNDIDWITNALLGPGADPDRELGPDTPGASAQAKPNGIQRLAERTTAFDVLKSNLTSRLSAARLLVDELPPRADAIFAAYLRAFIAEARLLGARPVLSTFATRHTASTRASVPSDIKLALRRVNLYLSMDGWIDMVERFNDVIHEVAEAEGVLLVDIAAAIADEGEQFRDFSHLQLSGHEIVAGVLFEALRELPELRPFADEPRPPAQGGDR